LHLQKAYAFLNYTHEDLPVATHVAAEIVSLPMFPHLGENSRQGRGGNPRLSCQATYGNRVITEEVMQIVKQPA